jgi:hypothetical protein
MNARRNTAEGTDPLERWAGRALGELPEPKAPRDMLPGILERVRREAATPWHRRPWMEWPVGLRWTSACAMALVVSLVGLQGDAFLEAAMRAVQRVDALRMAQDAGSSLLSAASMCLGVAARVWEQLPRPWFLAVVAALMALWISTVGLGAALWRLLRPNP